MGLTEHHLRKLTDEQCILMLGSYVREVKMGNNSHQRTDLAADTIRGYVKAAHMLLELMLGRDINILDKNHGGKRNKHHPFIGQQIADRRRWYKPRERYEPFTVDMFNVLADEILTAPDSASGFLGKVYCVYDWTRLGVFTGFRIGEYGQNSPNSFSCIPHDFLNVPVEYHGMPMAMMECDFQFFDNNFVSIPHEDLDIRHQKGEVLWLEIRWRYDKGASNFVKKKFQWTGHPIFCPVDAAVSIILRKTLLGVPSDHPIGVWQDTKKGGSSYQFVIGKDVSAVMRNACDLAYPNPNHYMRINRKRIVPHSNRVTAAVCLQKGGAENDEIAFKLRWHPTSVPTYLRECFQSIGATLEKAIAGVMKVTFASSPPT